MLHVPVLDLFPANGVCNWLPFCNEFLNVLPAAESQTSLAGIPWRSWVPGTRWLICLSLLTNTVSKDVVSILSIRHVLGNQSRDVNFPTKSILVCSCRVTYEPLLCRTVFYWAVGGCAMTSEGRTCIGWFCRVHRSQRNQCSTQSFWKK